MIQSKHSEMESKGPQPIHVDDTHSYLNQNIIDQDLFPQYLVDEY